MKKVAVVISLISLMLILSVPVAAGDPVAPMVPVRDDLASRLDAPQEAVEAMLQESKSKIPPKSAVGVSVPSGTLWLGGGSMGKMENVLLVSTLHPEQVRQYYLDKLPDMPGWKWSEEFGLFCKAEGTITVQQLMSFTIPVIEIEELSSDSTMLSIVDTDVREELQALLKITYPAR